MGVCIKFETEKPIIYPADGPAVTGPGSAFLTKQRDTGLFIVRLYARNDKSRHNLTGSHVLGTYKDENNARRVIDILERAVKRNAAAVYVPAENEAGDLITETGKPEPGRKYSKSPKITRQHIIDAIKENPAANNTEIAKMTGTYRGTVAKYRAALSRDDKADPET